MKTSPLTRALPANRVAALTAFLTGLAGCALSLAGAFPSHATNEIALIGGSVGALAGPLAHVVGSWLWQRTPAGQLEYHPARALPPEGGTLDTSGTGVRGS
jgi:hypothetical protein